MQRICEHGVLITGRCNQCERGQENEMPKLR